VACTQCHLANLKGNETIPASAGRPPTYQLRQMLAFRNGTRGGEAAAQMNPVVEKLTLEEMIDIVGYLASLPP
jgi:cytochrome c553